MGLAKDSSPCCQHLQGQEAGAAAAQVLRHSVRTAAANLVSPHPLPPTSFALPSTVPTSIATHSLLLPTAPTNPFPGTHPPLAPGPPPALQPQHESRTHAAGRPRQQPQQPLPAPDPGRRPPRAAAAPPPGLSRWPGLQGGGWHRSREPREQAQPLTHRSSTLSAHADTQQRQLESCTGRTRHDSTPSVPTTTPARPAHHYPSLRLPAPPARQALWPPSCPCAWSRWQGARSKAQPAEDSGAGSAAGREAQCGGDF